MTSAVAMLPTAIEVDDLPRSKPILRPVMLPMMDEFRMLQEYAKLAVESQCYEGVTNIARAMQIILKGYHLGIDPMEALMQIVYVGRKMTMQSQLMIALANRSRLLKVLEIPNPKNALEANQATVRAVRADRGDEYIGTFSKADAMQAGMWGKNVWDKYPGAMLVNRAVSLTLRRAIPEVLGGIYLAEELGGDIDAETAATPPERSNNPTMTIVSRPTPPTPQPDPEPDIPWYDDLEIMSGLLGRAVDAGYIEQGQGETDLLKLIGQQSWDVFATRADAGKAIKATVDMLKAAKPAATPTPPASTGPNVGDRFDVYETSALYDGKVISMTSPHGKLMIWSRSALAEMLGKDFDDKYGVTEWRGEANAPVRHTFQEIRITYEITKNGQPKIVAAVPVEVVVPVEIPF